MTEHEHDGAGRLIRSVTVREPLYLDRDRAELLALAEYRAGLCPRCGAPLEECTAPEKTGPRFRAERIRCQRTDAVLGAQQSLTDNTRHHGALVWSTTSTGR